VRHSRRTTVTTLLAAVVVPVLVAGPAHAIGSPSAVQAAAIDWTLIRTYPNQTACLTAGPAAAAGRDWRCTPSPRVPSAYDLYVST
jgi:hypothetical protein